MRWRSTEEPDVWSHVPRQAPDRWPTPALPLSPAVLNVKQVAALLNVSPRHVYRMVDGGLMPRPLKLGGLNRWPQSTLEQWLADGAPAVRN